MPKSHNKKRNVGVVYEMLLRSISESLVKGDNQQAQKTLDLITRRFKPNTELHREFRLFRALAKSSVSNSAIAAAILMEAKQAARKTDTARLEKEKSSLIREINYNLDGKNLYKRYISNYRDLATIQILLNEWRGEERSDIAKMAEYESKVIGHLLEKKNVPDLNSEANHDVNSLVVRLMTEKINKKYSGRFDNSQRELLSKYAFFMSETSPDTKDSVISHLSKIKNESLDRLNQFQEKNNNKYLSEKIDDVRDKIINETASAVNDKKVTRFLTLIDMCNQIEESINE
jgi:hypothetical protein